MAIVSHSAFRLAEAILIVVGFRPEAAQANGPRLDYEPVAMWAGDAGVRSSVPERLFLAVRLNAEDRGVFEFARTGQALWTDDDTLRKIGLALPKGIDQTRLALSGIPGLSTQFDEALQALTINADAALLAAPPVAVNQLRSAIVNAESTTGLVLNYDIFGGGGGGSADISGLLALRAVTGRTVIETTGLAQWGHSANWTRSKATRLDTSLSHVWPERGLRLTLGDFISSSLSWSRPTRIGGVQIGTDSGLQPYVPTAPMPAFMGTAALPSQVELFVDGVKRWNGAVPAGRFSVGAGPGRIDGQGRAQLVLTDIIGRVSTQEFSFYEAPNLLRKGLTQWSAAAGAVRLDYGDTSFSYANEMMLSGSARRGMTDRLTIETHGEAGAGMFNSGLGATWMLGSMGVISGSFAISTGRSAGRQWSLGYSLRSGDIFISAELRRAGAGYRDISSGWGAGPPLAVDNAQIGYSSQILGALSLGYLGLVQADKTRWRFATLNWSRPLTRKMSLNLGLRQNIDSRADRAAFLSLSFTPGVNRYASLGLQSQGSNLSYTGSFQQNAPVEGGSGWRADVLNTKGRWHGQAQVNWLGDFGEGQARFEAAPGSLAVHAGLSGSIAMLDGAVFASRRIEDGFALVSTGEAADIPVLVHNRPVGKSGRNGRLLVTQLRAFQENVIAIDTSTLDEPYAVGTSTAIAVPSDRSGVRVAFPVRKIHSAIATVTDRFGQVIKSGATARIEGMEQLETIGFDGMLYLEQPHAGALVTIEQAAETCSFRLPSVIPPGVQTKLGTFVCADKSP